MMRHNIVLGLLWLWPWCLAAAPCDEMALIPGGTFRMGDANDAGRSDEQPVHDVLVDEFMIDRCETSNAEVRRLFQWAHDRQLVNVTTAGVFNVEGEPRLLLDIHDWNSEIRFADGVFTLYAGRDNFPCIEVTWYGALAFCNFRSLAEDLIPCIDMTNWSLDVTQSGYRLPTEAEWEKACRGGLEGHYFPWVGRAGAFTNHVDGSKANYWQSGDRYEIEGQLPYTTPTAYYNGHQRPPGLDMSNRYSLYDMAGNVAEWCWDYYDSDWYGTPEASQDNPVGPAKKKKGRVLRGGSGLSGQKRAARGQASGRELAVYLRCAERAGAYPDRGTWHRGFRCARRPPEVTRAPESPAPDASPRAPSPLTTDPQ